MIVPVAFTVTREEEPETFALQRSEIIPSHAWAKLRVKLVLFDTDTGSARGFSAQVMFDQGAEPGHELMTEFRSDGGLPDAASEDYMRALRDKLDELLVKPSRWEAFSVEELVELDSIVDAAEESYSISSEALRLHDQIASEIRKRQERGTS